MIMLFLDTDMLKCLMKNEMTFLIENLPAIAFWFNSFYSNDVIVYLKVVKQVC